MLLWLLTEPAAAFDLLAPQRSASFTVIDEQLNTGSWAAANLLDDDTGSAWLSDRRDNDLIIRFDGPLNARCFSRFTLENYNSSRSVEEFVLLHTMDPSLSEDTGAAGWIPVIADPNPTGLINHLHWGQGGRLLAHDTQLNDSSWAARHLNNGSLGDYWLSNRNNNVLEFAFDTDWDGATGDAVGLDGVALSNYGGSRSIERFQVEYTRDGTGWQKLELPGSSAGDPDFNFALSREGGRLDLIEWQLSSTSWAAANIHDGSSNSIWLSNRPNNRLDFSFDPDGDGQSGLEGDTGDGFTLETISLENYGGSRSVRTFQILVQTTSDTDWRALPVPGTAAGEADFNFALSHNGTVLSAIDRELNAGSWAAANIHDGASQSIWLSNQANNTLDFLFDTDGDGSPGGAADSFRLERFALQNYGGSRSVEAFQIEIKTSSAPDWRKLEVPGTGAGDAGFNFLLHHEGGRLTSVDAQLNGSSYAGANIHDGSPLSYWLSRRPDNTLEFAFDTDLDGSDGDAIEVDRFRLENYGGSRSVAGFELDVRIAGGPWQTVDAPGGGTLFSATSEAAAQEWAIGPFNDVTAFRLRTQSNHGSSYTGIREIALLGTATGPGHTFLAGSDSAEQVFAVEPATGIEGVTAVRLRTIRNYGSSYTGVRELRLLGTSTGRPTVFEAAQGSDPQQFILDPADRPENVTAVRLKTISNYGSSYVGVRELELLGPAVAPSHTFTAGDGSERQVFMLDPEDRIADVKGVRLLTLDNHGSSYIGAREFEVLGAPVGPSFVFKAARESGEQGWDFDAVTARLFRFHTTNNFGSSYTGAREIGLESAAACGPLGLWHMDEARWGTVRDSSGNGIDGIARNGPDTAYDDPVVPDTPGTCRYGVFDGQDDYVALPTMPNLSESFTVTAWIRPADLGNDQRIFADDQSNSGGFAFSLGDGGDGRLRFFSRQVSPIILDSPPVIARDEWRFVAIVHDAATKSRRIYVDGGDLVAQDSYTGVWGVDPGDASIGGEVDGTSEARARWRFSGGLDEVRVYTRALAGGELAYIKDLTHPCQDLGDPGAPAFGFNCVQPGTDALAGRLYTKVVGAAFDLDVYALRDANGDGTADAVEAEYAQAADRSVSLELVDATGGAACTDLPPLQPAVSVPLVFQAADAGRKPVSGVSLNRAYRAVRCRITDAGDDDPVTACSSDVFAVRPAALSLQTPALGNAGHSGTPKARVGDTFALSVGGGVGYDGTPVIASDGLEPHAGAVRVGTLSGLFSAAEPADGIASGASFRYSEVGNFRFAAGAIEDSGFTAVDPPTDCRSDVSDPVPDVTGRVGCLISNAAASDWVGRFTPDRFEVMVQERGALGNSCTGFSYAGTGLVYATDPVIRVTAMGQGADITRNYTGDYAKLTPDEIGLSTLDADAAKLGLDGTTAVGINTLTGTRSRTDNGNGTLDFTLSGDVFTYQRGANERVSEFIADISRQIQSVQDDEDGTQAIALPVTLSPDGVPVRYGRLRLINAHGSELENLAVPMRIEAVAGVNQTFEANPQDQCTMIGVVTLADADTGDALTVAQTCVVDDDDESGVFACGGTGDAGLQYNATPSSIDATFNLHLSAPSGGQTGVLRVGADAPPWLEFAWDGATQSDPEALATFGIYRGDQRLIFMREVR